MIKRIRQREFLIEVVGPVFVNDYVFTIKFGEYRHDPELFNSITNGVGNMKTMKIAQEMGSFAANEMWKISTSGYKGKADWYRQLQELADTINVKLKKKM